MARFAYTIQYVPDVVQSISFYEKVFGFKRKFIAPGNEYGELDTGSTTLSFAAVSLAQTNLKDGFTESTPAGKPFGIEIGITTDDVETLYKEAIQAGAAAVEAPRSKPWGQVVAYVRDLNGFLIEICTPME